MIYVRDMYEVIIKSRFSAAHQLRHLGGICENLHGHNWNVDIHVISEKLNDIGVVIDFEAVENVAKKIIEDQFDHQVLNEIPYFQDVNPSAENIARYLFEEINRALSCSHDERRDSSPPPRVALAQNDPGYHEHGHPEARSAEGSQHAAVVKKVTVWETDTCGASYSC